MFTSKSAASLIHLIAAAPLATVLPGNQPVAPVDNSNFKIAIVGAIGLILSVSIPALIATFNKSRTDSPAPVESELEKELRRRAEAAEKIVDNRDLEISQRTRGAELRDRYIEDLENYLWSTGVDPGSIPHVQTVVSAVRPESVNDAQ